MGCWVRRPLPSAPNVLPRPPPPGCLSVTCPPHQARWVAKGGRGPQDPRAGRTFRGQDAHHVEEAAVREDARQDLGLQVLGHGPPRVPADGHQHVAGRVLVRLVQLLRARGASSKRGRSYRAPGQHPASHAPAPGGGGNVAQTWPGASMPSPPRSPGGWRLVSGGAPRLLSGQWARARRQVTWRPGPPHRLPASAPRPAPAQEGRQSCDMGWGQWAHSHSTMDPKPISPPGCAEPRSTPDPQQPARGRPQTRETRKATTTG